MSMHKIPLTQLEEDGLRAHGLDIGSPSQLSDVFRHGIKWALEQTAPQPENSGLTPEGYADYAALEAECKRLSESHNDASYYASLYEELRAAQTEQQPELTVWEGAMPESNGKSNFTAILARKGRTLLDTLADGFTIARSEYPDRVRYEADCVRWLIGEMKERPWIIDYDTDKHSGYAPIAQTAPQQENDHG